MRAAITLAVLSVLLVWLPLDELGGAIRRVRAWVWLGVLACALLAHLMAAFKWRLLLRACGLRPGLTEALRAHLAGLFANLCLPSLVGGDLVRAGMLLRQHRAAPLAVGSLADRVLDTTGLVLLSAVGALWFPDVVGELALEILGVAVLALAAGTLLAPLALRRLDPAWLPPRLGAIAVRLREAVDALARRPAAAAAALAISLAVQASYVALNAWLGRIVGIEVPLAAWYLLWPLAKLVALIPISLGGIGLREAALAGLLAPLGVPPPLAVAQGLVWDSITIATGLAAGGVSLWMRKLPGQRERALAGREAA